MGHTAKYLANKLRRKMALKEERKAAGLPEDEESPVSKRLKTASTAPSLQEIEALRDKGLKLLIDQMTQGTEQIYKGTYGDQWKEGMKYEQQKLLIAQEEARARNVELEESERRGKEEDQISLRGTGLFLDDYDPRY